MKKTLTLILLVIFAFGGNAQNDNVKNYLNAINSAEEHLLQAGFFQANNYYHQAFDAGIIPFNNDLNNALITSIMCNDSAMIKYCASEMYARFINVNMYAKYMTILKDMKGFEYFQKTVEDSTFYRSKSKIDTDYNRIIDSLFVVDQEIRYNSRNKSQEKAMRDIYTTDSANFIFFTNYIKKRGFYPAENQIKTKDGNIAGGTKLEIFYKHWSSLKNEFKLFLKILKNEVDKGNFNPKFYAFYYDCHLSNNLGCYSSLKWYSLKKMRSQYVKKHFYYGTGYFYKKRGPNYDFRDYSTIPKHLEKLTLSTSQIKHINKFRKRISMESVQNSFNKIEFQNNISKYGYLFYSSWSYPIY